MLVCSKARLDIEELRVRKRALEALEAADARRAVSLAVHDPDTSERFARAETAVDRRMYRALALLIAMTMRTGGPANLVPQLKLAK